MPITQSNAFNKPIKVMEVESSDKSFSSKLISTDVRILFKEGVAIIDLYEWGLKLDYSANLDISMLKSVPSNISYMTIYEGELNDFELLQIHKLTYMMIDGPNLILLNKNGNSYSVIKVFDLDGEGVVNNWDSSKLRGSMIIN